MHASCLVRTNAITILLEKLVINGFANSISGVLSWAVVIVITWRGVVAAQLQENYHEQNMSFSYRISH